MLCVKCGNQIPDGSAVCDGCGAKLTQETAAPAKPNFFAALAAKAKAIHQKNKWIFPIAGAVLVAAIALLIVFSIPDKQMSMRDYVNIKAEGYDGYGYVSIDFGYNSFAARAAGDKKVDGYDEELEKDAVLDTESSMSQKQIDTQKLAASVTVEYQLPDGKENGFLSNGDVITITVECDEDRARELGLTIKDTSFTYTVEGLTPVAKFDVLSWFEIAAEGYDGYGTASMKVNKTATEQVGDITFTIEEGKFAITWQKKDGQKGNFKPQMEESSGELFNGDKVIVTIKASGDMFINEGVQLIGLEKEYTVSGLTDSIKVDLLQYYDVKFIGRDGHGHAGVYRTQDKLTFGDLEFDLLWREWLLDGKVKWETDIYVDPNSELTNGDTVTLKVGGDLSFLRSYGIVITNLEKEFTVSNLGDYASSLSEIKDYTDYETSAWAAVENYLYDNWNYAIHGSSTNNYFGDKKIEDVNVHKVLLQVYPEENVYYRNKLWLVFSANVSDESMSQPKQYYFLVGYHNAVVHQDGTLYFGDKTGGYDIQFSSDSYEKLKEKWISSDYGYVEESE